MDEYEKLIILREETRLDPISAFRVYRECKKAEHLRNVCEIHDSKHVYSVDYTNAYELELKLRMKALTVELVPVWKAFVKCEGERIVLDDFVNTYIKNCYIKKEKEKGEARTLKQ